MQHTIASTGKEKKMPQNNKQPKRPNYFLGESTRQNIKLPDGGTLPIYLQPVLFAPEGTPMAEGQLAATAYGSKPKEARGRAHIILKALNEYEED